MDVLGFYLIPFFKIHNPTQKTTLHSVLMSPQAPLGCDSFSELTHLDDLSSFEGYSSDLCRTSLGWDVAGVFLLMGVVLAVLGGTAQR